MKFGATTLHRAFAIGRGRCKGWQDNERQGARYVKVRKRLKRATFVALDEISMIGKQMLGKINFRTRDTLGDESKDYDFQILPSLNGKDCVINGHMLQARPIGDTEAYREMAKQGSSVAAAKERVPDEPSKEDFATQGHLFFKEFEDVMMLRAVHRTYDEADERVKNMATAEERKQFLEESDKFQGVLERMSDLSWSAEDHAWLSQRNQSVLARTAEGRRELEAFEGSLVLMDTKVDKESSGEGRS